MATYLASNGTRYHLTSRQLKCKHTLNRRGRRCGRAPFTLLDVSGDILPLCETHFEAYRRAFPNAIVRPLNGD